MALQASETAAFNTRPHLVVDESGNVTALWTEFHDMAATGYGPHYNRYEPANGGWRGAEPIDAALPTLGFSNAVVDAAGNITAVTRSGDSEYQILLAYRFDAAQGTWGGAIQINDPWAGRVRAGPVANEAGDVFVVIEDNSNTLNVARYNHATDSWVLGTTVTAPGHTVGNNGEPQLAVDAAGNAVVVYGALSGTSRVWAVRFDSDSGQWSTAHELGEAIYPMVAAQPDGSFFTLWQEAAPDDIPYSYRGSFYGPTSSAWSDPVWVGGRALRVPMGTQLLTGNPDGFLIGFKADDDFFTTRYSVANGFEHAELHDAFGYPSSEESLRAAPDGGAWAFWVEYNGEVRTVVGRQFSSAAGWGEPTSFDDIAGLPAALLEAVVDRDGTPTAIWMDTADDMEQNLRSTCFDSPSQAWSDPQEIEMSWQASNYLAMVVDDNGIVTVIWLQYSGTRHSIWANRFE